MDLIPFKHYFELLELLFFFPHLERIKTDTLDCEMSFHLSPLTVRNDINDIVSLVNGATEVLRAGNSSSPVFDSYLFIASNAVIRVARLLV